MGHHTPGGPSLRKGISAGEPEIPEADETWHPIAIQWYESLMGSGQAQYYEQSDWATAYYVAEFMSKNCRQAKPSAQMFQSIMSAMTDLLTTEGARRRARVELERVGDETPVENPTVTLMDKYRKAAGTT